MKRVLLLQLDGKMPNIALMRVAAHHRERGDSVVLEHAATTGSVERGLWDRWDMIYASLIFKKTKPTAERLLAIYPWAIVGGTGWEVTSKLEDHGITTKKQDYSDYPKWKQSIGFTQRGCRLNCGFCVVPEKEGKNRAEQTIRELWRGEPWPRELILLDNDFFGQPDWRAIIKEIRDGEFKVSLSQGINARMLNDEAAEALASVNYRNDDMKRPCIHTAWDSLGDERPLFRGLEALKRCGVNPDHITVYMLVGYDDDTKSARPFLIPEDFERHRKLRDFGCRPYPMPYVRPRELTGFQRWIVGAYDKRVSWKDWVVAGYEPRNLGTQTDEPGMFDQQEDA